MKKTFLFVLALVASIAAQAQSFTPPVQTNNISYTNLVVIVPSSTDQRARLDFLSALTDSAAGAANKSVSIYDGATALATVSAYVPASYTNAVTPFTGAVFTNFFPFLTSASSNSIAVGDHLAIYIPSSNSFPNKGWFYRVAVTPLTTNVAFSGGNLMIDGSAGAKLYAWRNTGTIVPPLILTAATEKTITAPTGWFSGTAGKPLLISVGITNTGANQLLISGTYVSAYPQ